MRSKILCRRVKGLGWLAKEQSSFITELLVCTKVAIVFLPGGGQPKENRLNIKLSYKKDPKKTSKPWLALKLQSPHLQGTLRGDSAGTCMGISDSKCIEVAQRPGLSTSDLQDSRESCPSEAGQCLPMLRALCWTL